MTVMTTFKPKDPVPLQQMMRVAARPRLRTQNSTSIYRILVNILHAFITIHVTMCICVDEEEITYVNKMRFGDSKYTGPLGPDGTPHGIQCHCIIICHIMSCYCVTIDHIIACIDYRHWGADILPRHQERRDMHWHLRARPTGGLRQVYIQ